MAFFTTAALIAGGAALGGSLISANASRSAANAQTDAANRGIDTQRQMFEQIQGNLSPYRDAGQQGLSELMRQLGFGPNGYDPNAALVKPFGMTDFQQDPSYQWRLQQGNDAILANRAATGGIQSGRTLKDLTRFSQGLASTEYGNAFNRYNLQQGNVYNRLAALAGTGQNAAVQQGGFGQNAAGNIAGLQYAQGQAQAGGELGQANALVGAGGQALNQFLLGYNAQNRGSVSPWMANTYANPLFGPGAPQMGGPGGGDY